MLNADMALAFDMEGYLDPTSGAVTCVLASNGMGKTVCPSSLLRARAQLYSNENLVWVKDFESVFLKVANAGCGKKVCKRQAAIILSATVTTHTTRRKR